MAAASIFSSAKLRTSATACSTGLRSPPASADRETAGSTLKCPKNSALGEAERLLAGKQQFLGLFLLFLNLQLTSGERRHDCLWVKGSFDGKTIYHVLPVLRIARLGDEFEVLHIFPDQGSRLIGECNPANDFPWRCQSSASILKTNVLGKRTRPRLVARLSNSSSVSVSEPSSCAVPTQQLLYGEVDRESTVERGRRVE